VQQIQPVYHNPNPTEVDAEDTDLPEFAFGNFRDINQIPLPVQKAVAMAYHDGVLDSVFGLTPEALVNEVGFQADKPVTRAQALVFLYRFITPKIAQIISVKAQSPSQKPSSASKPLPIPSNSSYP